LTLKQQFHQEIQDGRHLMEQKHHFCIVSGVNLVTESRYCWVHCYFGVFVGLCMVNFTSHMLHSLSSVFSGCVSSYQTVPRCTVV